MPYCAVKLCGKSSTTSSLSKDGITFHRFPKCPKINIKWTEATKRKDWFPTKYSYVCSIHFTEDSFHPGNRRILFSNAVPTQMLPFLMSHVSDVSNPSTQMFQYPEVSNPSTSATIDMESHALTTQPSVTTNKANIESNMSQVSDSSNPSTQTFQSPEVSNPSTSATMDTESYTLSTQRSATINNANFELNESYPAEPSTSAESDLHQNSIILCESSYSTPTIRRLLKSVIDLTQKLKKKNVVIKRLRDSNRGLKRKVDSLKQIIERKKKALITQDSSSILAHIGLQSKEITKRVLRKKCLLVYA